jgi:pyruvate dehydrogenase E1 component beta subunit
VKKTGRLVAVDSGSITGSISGEIVSKVSSQCFSELKCAPIRLAQPDVPEPTSFGLTTNFHIRASSIVSAVGRVLNKSIQSINAHETTEIKHDVPGLWFKGPF